MEAEMSAPENTATELMEMVRQFEEAEETTSANRALCERDQDYFDNKQLTEKEIKALEKRGQPAVVFNEIKPKVKTMLGLEKQTRKDPKAFPRNPADEKAADAATDAIRFVCDDSRWDDKRSKAAEDLAVRGTCAMMIGVKETKDGVDPELRRIHWDRFYYDPASSEFDFSDAAFMGIVIWMDLDEARRKYPEAKDVLTDTWAAARDSDTYDDKPKNGLWVDYKRKRVRLCEHYYNDGGWKFCIFTKGGFVIEPMDSPYLGEEDRPECPIKAVSLYIDRDNNRYGEVRAMIDPQDEVNKRRSKALHLISQRQVRVSPAAGMDPAAIRKELAKPDGVFVGDVGDVEILPTADMASGNLALLQDARDHIHRTGANSALAGKGTESQSGRAIIAQQQGGIVEEATYLDCIRVLSMAVYRSVWSRVRQYWDGPRWVRVTDNENNLRFVGLNQPITALKQAAQQLGVDPTNLQASDPQAVAMLEAFAKDPRSQVVVGVENSVTELDVDIWVDEGVDTPTIQAEQFDLLAKMVPALGPMAQDPRVIKLVVQASSFRNKDELLEIIDQIMQPAPQQDPAQLMEMQKQAALEQAQFEAGVELDKAKINAVADIEVARIKAGVDAENKKAQLALDIELETQKRLAEAETQAQVDETTGHSELRRAEVHEKLTTADAMQQMAAVLAELARPKVKIPVRDEQGLIVGIEERAA